MSEEIRAPHVVGALATAAYCLYGGDSMLSRATAVAGVMGLFKQYEDALLANEEWRDKVSSYGAPLAAGAFLAALPCAGIGLLRLPMQDWVCGTSSTLSVRILYSVGCGSIIWWAFNAGGPLQDEEGARAPETPPRGGSPSTRVASPFRAAVAQLYGWQ